MFVVIAAMHKLARVHSRWHYEVLDLPVLDLIEWGFDIHKTFVAGNSAARLTAYRNSVFFFTAFRLSQGSGISYQVIAPICIILYSKGWDGRFV
jgi:hypothetical protein